MTPQPQVEPVVWDNKSRVVYADNRYVGAPESSPVALDRQPEREEIIVPETLKVPAPPSYVIWENRNGLNHLHGRVYGDSVEDALNNLAKEQTYKDGPIVYHCTDMNDWFKRKGTDLSKFRFQKVEE